MNLDKVIEQYVGLNNLLYKLKGTLEPEVSISRNLLNDPFPKIRSFSNNINLDLSLLFYSSELNYNEDKTLFVENFKEQYYDRLSYIKSKVDDCIKNRKILCDHNDVFYIDFLFYDPYFDATTKIDSLRNVKELSEDNKIFLGDLEYSIKEMLKNSNSLLKDLNKVSKSSEFSLLMFKSYRTPKEYYSVRSFLNKLNGDITHILKNFEIYQKYLDFPSLYLYYSAKQDNKNEGL